MDPLLSIGKSSSFLKILKGLKELGYKSDDAVEIIQEISRVDNISKNLEKHRNKKIDEKECDELNKKKLKLFSKTRYEGGIPGFLKIKK